MTALKIVSIILKPVELTMLVVGMGLVAHFTKEFHDYTTQGDTNIDPYDFGVFGRYEFYLFSTGVGVAIAALGFTCALGGMLEKKYGALAMVALQALWAFHLLIATALLTKSLATFEKKVSSFSRFGTKISTCKSWDKSDDYKDYDFSCSQLYGAVACGFLAMVVFAVDTLISLISFTRAHL